MRLLVPALTVLSITAALSAQEYYGYNASNVSSLTRSGLDHQGGEIHLGFLQQFNRGLGDTGTDCAISQVFLFLRDQNGLTQENFGLVVRSGNDKVGPYPAASALLYRFPGWTLGSNGGGALFSCITLTFASPLKLPNCKNFWSFGVEFPANHSWPNDGLCLFGQDQAMQKVNGHAVRNNWSIKGGFTRPSPYSDWTYAGCFGIGMDSPAMRMGEYGGHQGMKALNGHFPATGSSYQAMIHYGPGWDGGLSMLYVGLGRQPGIQLLPGTGKFYLTSPTLFLTGATIGTGCCGHTEHDLVPSIPASWSGLGKYHFQSVGIANNKATLSNVVTVRF